MNTHKLVTCVLIFIGLPALAEAQIHPSPSVTHPDSAFLFQSKILTQLEDLPFRGQPEEYYNLFSGVVVQDFRGTDFVHVRGGRHDEIGYAFEGADIRSVFSGRNLIRFIPEALERLSLESSPTVSSSSTAGLIRHRMRTGGPDLKFTLRGETDRFTAQHESRLDTYSYGYDDLLLLSEGKIGTDNVRFFVAGERETFDDPYRKFWNGFRFGDPDTPFVDTFSGEPLQDVLGSNEIVVRPGNIPTADFRRYALNGIITADLKPFEFRMVGVLNDEERRQNDTPIQDIFNQERIPEHNSTRAAKVWIRTLGMSCRGRHGTRFLLTSVRCGSSLSPSAVREPCYPILPSWKNPAGLSPDTCKNRSARIKSLPGAAGSVAPFGSLALTFSEGIYRHLTTSGFPRRERP